MGSVVGCVWECGRYGDNYSKQRAKEMPGRVKMNRPVSGLQAMSVSVRVRECVSVCEYVIVCMCECMQECEYV